MAVVYTQTYGTTSTAAITSLNTLTFSNMTATTLTAAQCASQSNTVANARDVLIQIGFRSGTAITNGKALYVYAYGSENGTKLTTPATGSDATIAIENPTQSRLIGVIPTGAASTSYDSQPMSLAAAFGGIVPRLWGVFVVNDSGSATVTTTNYPYLNYTNITDTGT